MFDGQKNHYARTYSHALKLASAFHKQQPEALPKKRSLQSMRKRMAAWMPLYSNRLPGDVENLKSVSRQHAAMFRQHPALMYFLIILKYAYPRQLWVTECIKHGMAKKNGTVSVEQMVSKISDMLRKVTLQLNGWWESDAAKPWIRNCGKNVSHVLGPVPLLHSCGVIVTTKGRKRKHSTDNFTFGLTGRTFRLAMSQNEKTQLDRRLEAIVRGSHAWRGIVQDPPGDLVQWGRSMTQLGNTLRASCPLPLMHNSTKYAYKWIARNLCIMSMTMKGIPKLKWSHNMAAAHLDGHFPDSQGWGKRFAHSGKGRLKLCTLFDDLQFKEAPELFTMRTCQLACKELDQCDPAEVTRNRTSLEVLMRKYRKQHKQWPAPHELISVALQAEIL